MTETEPTASEPSEWQQKITGTWYGRPSVFDATGTHQGYEIVSRASEFKDGVTTYWMRTRLQGGGPLRSRFELGAQFDFGVTDSDENRVYNGPDFYGTGQPYGSFVDSHYYSPAWQADLRTWNQVLADGVTQVYSSVLHDGWTVCAVFNGVYKVAHDYDTNSDTRTAIDQFLALEMERGTQSQILPTKESGAWVGELEVVAADRLVLGKVSARIEHEPLDLRRVRQHVTLDGVVSRDFTFQRTREGNRVQYDGPDIWGNAMSYGRVLYTSQHADRDVWKIKGREFLIDLDQRDLAVVWEYFDGDTISHVIHGLLKWESRS